MFELEWWCYVVSAVLGVPVLFDARRRGLTIWAVVLWTASVALTWVAVVPYVVTRSRHAAGQGVRV